MTKQSAGQTSVQCHVSKQSRSPGQSWCSLAWQRREICPVSILAHPLLAESLISKLQVQCDSARTLVWSTQETHQQVPHTRCFLTFAPVSGAFFKPTSCRLLILSCLRALLILSNCAGCLGNPFKSFLYWDRTLQQGSYSHHLQTHTHAGRVNPGQANMHSWTGDRLLKNYPTTPTHELSQHTQKENPTQHIVPFPLWAPICGWLRNSKGVIRLSFINTERERKRGEGEMGQIKWETRAIVCRRTKKSKQKFKQCGNAINKFGNFPVKHWVNQPCDYLA